MASDVLAVADRLWNGEISTANFHPLDQWAASPRWPTAWLRPVLRQRRRRPHGRRAGPGRRGQPAPVRPGAPDAPDVDAQRLHTAVYSHGHIDHVFGVERMGGRGRASTGLPGPGWWPTRRAPRFDRYIRTAGYNTVVNRRQFGIDDLSGRPSTATPTGRSATGSISTSAGCGPNCATPAARPTTTPGLVRRRRVLCTGDLFIWASPNAGNPQKVQRFPLEWAEALRRC